MIDPHGVEWLAIPDAARAVRVRPSAIYVWINRRKVRAHRIKGRAYVHMGDLMTAEHAWRQRVRDFESSK